MIRRSKILVILMISIMSLHLSAASSFALALTGDNAGSEPVSEINNAISVDDSGAVLSEQGSDNAAASETEESSLDSQAQGNSGEAGPFNGAEDESNSSEVQDLDKSDDVALQAAAIDDSNIYVSASGNDDTGDGSEQNPYATLKKAISEAASGGTIYLLSNLDSSESLTVSKSIIIKSKEGSGPYTFKRTSTYDGSMISLAAPSSGATLSLENIVLDDNNTKASSDEQNGIVEAVENGNIANVILGSGTTLQNYGGFSGIYIGGSKAKVVMEADSLITNHGNTGITGRCAVRNYGGTFIMEKDAKIDNATGRGVVGAATGVALLQTNGSSIINGIISNCKCTAGSTMTILSWTFRADTA